MLARLMKHLLQADLLDDARKAAADEAYRNELFKKYHLMNE